MKISLLQMQSKLGKPEENRRSAEKMIEAAMQHTPDIIVLPEMWNTGFFPPDVAACADQNDETRALIGALAKQYGVYIVGGSAAVRRSDGLHNIACAVDRQGAVIASYRKAHLFSPSGEDKVFLRGDAPCIFDVEGVRAAIVICYDIRFCEWLRLLALEGVELLFVPAAWPHPRLMHWNTLLRARAIENQMFVAAVNQAGWAGTLHFCGASALIDPWGEVLAQAGGAEEIVSSAIDFSVLRESREKINVFNDRREDLYFLERCFCKPAYM